MNSTIRTNATTTRLALNSSGIQISINAVLSILYMILITGLNGLVVYLFIRIAKNKKSVRFSDFLFLSITLSDLAVGIFTMFLEIVIEIWFVFLRQGVIQCYLNHLHVQSQYLCSPLALLLLSAHRYMQINYPLIANEKMTRLKIGLILSTWLIPYGFWLIVISILSSQGRLIYHLCLLSIDRLLLILAISIISFIPTLSAIAINILTMVSLFKSKRKREVMSALKAPFRNINAKTAVSTNDSAQRNNEEPSQLNDSLDLDKENSINTTNPSVTQANQKSEAKQQKKASRRLAKEVKALTCICAILINLFMTQTIYSVVRIANIYCLFCINGIPFSIINWINYSFSLINPIILLIFHELYNSEVRKLICLAKKN
jgi:hypothetical protein